MFTYLINKKDSLYPYRLSGFYTTGNSDFIKLTWISTSWTTDLLLHVTARWLCVTKARAHLSNTCSFCYCNATVSNTFLVRMNHDIEHIIHAATYLDMAWAAFPVSWPANSFAIKRAVSFLSRSSFSCKDTSCVDGPITPIKTLAPLTTYRRSTIDKPKRIKSGFSQGDDWNASLKRATAMASPRGLSTTKHQCNSEALVDPRSVKLFLLVLANKSLTLSQSDFSNRTAALIRGADMKHVFWARSVLLPFPNRNNDNEYRWL